MSARTLTNTNARLWAASILWAGLILFGQGCAKPAAASGDDAGRRYIGILIVDVADNFEQNTSEVYYYLVLDDTGNRVRLHFRKSSDFADLLPGVRAEITGRPRDGAIDVDTIRVLERTNGTGF